MKKRLIAIISIAFGITAIILATRIGTMDKNKETSSDEALLERLLQDESPKSSERLKELTSRRDAVGYYANLALGDRLSRAQKEDAHLYYKQALELYSTREVRRKYADTLLKQGNVAEASQMYVSALPDEGAFEKVKSLELDSAVLAGMLIESKQWQTAEDFLKSEIAKNYDACKKLSLRKLYANVLGERKKYKELKPIVEKLMQEDPKDTDLKYWYGRCIEASGDLKKAREFYAASGAKGANQLGFLLDKEGKFREAAEAYSKGTDTDSVWKASKLYDETGNTDSALEGYLKLAKENTVYKDDAAYRAYVILSARNLPQAKEMLDIISTSPGWMARLGMEPSFEKLSNISYTKPEFLDRVERYRSEGKDTMAYIELSIGEKYADLNAMLALGDWYLAQGDYYTASGWGMKALKGKKVSRAYELAYPRHFKDMGEKHSKEFNIDPNLLYALIRQESGFNQSAGSSVGAQGLTQLMPATAEDIAKKLKVTISREGLLDPDINIRFGAYYLRSMLNSFSGDEDKALAAYNGGAGNVRRWSRTNLGSTKKSFPTSVNFYETREYITRVMNSYYTYKWLYKDK